MPRLAVRIATMLAVSLVASSVRAATAQWILDNSASATDRAIATAGDWFDGANWTNGFVATGADVGAAFWPNKSNWSQGTRYVKLSAPVTVGNVVRDYNNTQQYTTWDANRRVIIGGDNELSLSVSSGGASLAGLSVFAPVKFASSASANIVKVVDFCGPVTNASGKGVTIKSFHSYPKDIPTGVRFRRDLWADTASEEVAFPVPSSMTFDSGASIAFIAPRGVEASQSMWKTVAGSNRIVSVGDIGAVTVGSSVSCEGYIADGAFVRCIYPDGSLALSSDALQSSGDDGVELSFGAFHPHARHSLSALSFVGHSSRSYVALQAMKYAWDDDFVLELPDFPANNYYVFRIRTEPGYVPARVVLHNTNKAADGLELFDCDVEFAAPTNGTACGYPKDVWMGSDSSTARVTVGAELSASISSLTNVVGTFVKKGAGTLTAPVPSNADFAASGTGKVVVEAGTLTLTCDSGDAIQVNTLAITNGATLTIPSCGLEARAVFAESGAVVDGTGFFYAVETNDLSGISFGAGVTVVRLRVDGASVPAANVYWETNVTAGVVGNPALWFDASKRDSFEFADETVSRRAAFEDMIIKWYDARGAEYGCATCFWKNASTPLAQCLYTNELGETRMVMVNYSNTTDVDKRNVLQWSQKATGIRSVFKVIASYGTTGVFFGDSNLKRGNSSSYAYNKPLFSNVSELYTNSLAFYVNGDRRDWRMGYPYGVTSTGGTSYYSGNPDLLVRELAELHFPDDTTYAGCFGYNGRYDDGRDYLFECLVYTNELTEVERLSVRKYLMNKWLDGMNYSPAAFDGAGTLDVGSGVAYRVDADEALVYSEITGDGALTKYGAGTLAVAKTASNALHVAEGRMTMRSLPVPTRDALPGNAYLHLDASAADTLVVENGKVVSWADVRGEGHPTATALNAGKGPAFEENALNGMPAVDFGGRMAASIATYGTKCPTLVYDPVSNAHAVVAVLVSTNGGGPLIGWHVQSQTSVYGDYLNGLDRNLRYNGGSVDNPIVWNNPFGGKNYFYDLAYPLQAGGSRVRLNGEEVDGTTTPFTCNGVYDMVSLVSHRPIRAGAIGQVGYNNNVSYFNYGGYKIAEMLLYTNVISRAEVKAVEAYLNRKWFNRVSEDYEPAAAKDVAVDAGATLEIYGGAPLAVESLSGEGTVSGAVAMEDDAVLEVVVNGDGSLAIPNVTDGIDLLGGGTVVVSGNVRALRPGTYDLAAIRSGTITGWDAQCLVQTRKTFKVRVADGVLRLEVGAGGVTIVFR